MGLNLKMKEWEVLSNEEDNYVWNQVMERFSFNPKYDSNNDMQFLKLPKPYCIYDMHLFEGYLKDTTIEITEEYYNEFNEHIAEIFINCMGTHNNMYALDWQHQSFRYNPKSNEKLPKMIEADNYNIYFPDFYPDGDYYFFIAKDFSWGYFTHPWTQQLWVFGYQLISEIKKAPSKYLTLIVEEV